MKMLLGALLVIPTASSGALGALQEPLTGERLEPSELGPGRIETLAHVRARSAAEPASSAVERRGSWLVPKRRATGAAHSGGHYVTNEWGDPRMEIGFPEPVELEGAWIGGQASDAVWPLALRAVGYLGAQRVGATSWFGPLQEEPVWFEIGLAHIDRVELEAVPVVGGAAWFTLDDLTFQRDAQRVVLDFEDRSYGEHVSGSGYAGLTWGVGSGFARPPAWDEDALPAPRAAVPAGDEPAPQPDGFLGGGGTAPVAIFDFEGPDRVLGNNAFPPDTCGAIGPDHYCAFVNRVFAVYDRVNGAQLFAATLQNFLPGATGDPRVLFDQHSGRWFVIATNFGIRIQLGVSMTSDPLGAWFKADFQAAAGSDAGCMVDYPTLGVDENGLYIGAFLFGGCALSLFAIDKAPLIAPAPSLGTITAFRNISPSTEGALQPAHSYGASQGEYVVSITTNAVRIRRVDPPLTAPTLTTVGAPAIPSHPTPLNVPSLGSNVGLKTFDTRFLNTVVRDDTIWTVHHVREDTRAAVRWYEIDALTNTVVQSGTIDDPELHYFYPSIAVNAARDVVVGFSGASASQYVGAYFSGRLSSDPPGEMAPPELLQPGAGAYEVLDPSGFNRWGDYSLTTLDPVGETRLWTIQEYGAQTDIWGTWIGALEFGGTVICPDPATYCVGAANSAGAGARIGSTGTTSGTIQDLVLTCTGCPANRPGTFYYGHAAIQLPFGDGFRCVGGGTYRLAPTTTDFFGDVIQPVDFSQPPAGSGPGELAVGTTWYFQFWYRDPAAGGAGFNLSDGLELLICP